MVRFLKIVLTTKNKSKAVVFLLKGGEAKGETFFFVCVFFWEQFFVFLCFSSFFFSCFFGCGLCVRCGFGMIMCVSRSCVPPSSLAVCGWGYALCHVVIFIWYDEDSTPSLQISKGGNFMSSSLYMWTRPPFREFWWMEALYVHSGIWTKKN